MRAVTVSDMKAFVKTLETRKVDTTVYLDPRGNALSARSLGHIHHPANLCKADAGIHIDLDSAFDLDAGEGPGEKEEADWLAGRVQMSLHDWVSFNRKQLQQQARERIQHFLDGCDGTINESQLRRIMYDHMNGSADHKGTMAFQPDLNYYRRAEM